MLTKISLNSLPNYKSFYMKNWPDHVVSVVIIDHYIDRIKKYPEWENKVDFYTLTKNTESTTEQDATFVLVSQFNWVYFDSLTNDVNKIKNILSQIKKHDSMYFKFVRDELKNVVDDFMNENSMEVDFNVLSTIIYDNSSEEEKNERIKAMKFFLRTSLPDEYALRNLTEEDAEFIHKNRPREFMSLEEFKICIKYNPSTVLYRKIDKHLMAWTILYDTGMSGNLFVDKNFRQQKLGKLVITAQSLKLYKENRQTCGNLVHGNEAALKFFLDFGATLGGSVNSKC